MTYYSYYPLHSLLLFIIVFTSSIVVVVVMAADAHITTTTPSSYPIIKYTTIAGYFLQDDPATNASTFDYVRYDMYYLLV